MVVRDSGCLGGCCETSLTLCGLTSSVKTEAMCRGCTVYIKNTKLRKACHLHALPECGLKKKKVEHMKLEDSIQKKEDVLAVS